MIRIGYMGIPGSFSEMAAQEMTAACFKEETELFPLISARNILLALQKGEIEYGVLGIENTTVGPVREFEESFSGVSYEVKYKDSIPVHHCLYKKRGIDTKSLKNVASHIHALAQTRKTRAKKYPFLKEIETEDTALSARQLSEGTLPSDTAVICSKGAGELWNLALIEENIEDSPDNRTIFWLLKLAI